MVVIARRGEESGDLLRDADLHIVEPDEVHRRIINHLLLNVVDECDALCRVKCIRQISQQLLYDGIVIVPEIRYALCTEAVAQECVRVARRHGDDRVEGELKLAGLEIR